MSLLKHIWNYVRPKTNAEMREAFLSQSIDMVDLERRIRLMDRYRNPFQSW